MKKKLTIIIAIALLIAGGIYVYSTYAQPFKSFKLPTRKDYQRREVTEKGREFGWVLGEVLIEFDDTKINLDTEVDAKKALKLVEQASSDLAPVVVQKMVDAGILSQDYLSEKQINKLRKELIVFGRMLGPNGAVLAVAIDGSEDIISEELKKYDGVEDASPNYIWTWF